MSPGAFHSARVLQEEEEVPALSRALCTTTDASLFVCLLYFRNLFMHLFVYDDSQPTFNVKLEK